MRYVVLLQGQADPAILQDHSHLLAIKVLTDIKHVVIVVHVQHHLHDSLDGGGHEELFHVGISFNV